MFVAFYDCNALTSVEIKEGATSIGEAAFNDCGALSLVTIPDSVTAIGAEAFDLCANDLVIHCSAGSAAEAYARENGIALSLVGKFGNGAKKDATQGARSADQEAAQPRDSMTLEAFSQQFGYECGRDGIVITSYWGGSGATEIPAWVGDEPVVAVGEYAFRYNTDLSEVVIAKGIKRIDRGAFYGCDTLVSVRIPDSVESIGAEAFAFCGMLSSLTIPNGVWDIGDSAFCGCEALPSIVIPGTVARIGDHAFSQCRQAASVTIGEGVIAIEAGAFTSCDALRSIKVPKSVRSIGGYAFWGIETILVDDENENYCVKDGLLFSKDMTLLHTYPSTRQDASFTIPGCVKEIGDRAFFDCTSLSSVTIPEGVTSIGEGAFIRCSGLSSIFVPASVNAIGSSAFMGISDVRVAENNPYFHMIDGVLYRKDMKLLLAYPMDKQDPYYAIPDGVKTIGGDAFCMNPYLTGITIPSGVVSIGECAFDSCSALVSADIPDGVTNIGASAFRGCEALKYIRIPEGVAKVEGLAFGYCSSATGVSIPKSVQSIAGYAFVYCTSLTSVEIPHGVSSIGEYAFYGCDLLYAIVIPDSVTYIGESAFSYCADDLVIYCSPGSAAEAYARENGIPFEQI